MIPQTMLGFQLGDIGGGVVGHPFRMGEKYMLRGTALTRDEILAIPASNRRALVERGSIRVWPMGAPERPAEVMHPPPAKSADAPAPSAETQKHLMHIGAGKYHVIEGRRLNEEPLAKEEALALAGYATD